MSLPENEAVTKHEFPRKQNACSALKVRDFLFKTSETLRSFCLNTVESFGMFSLKYHYDVRPEGHFETLFLEKYLARHDYRWLPECVGGCPAAFRWQTKDCRLWSSS